jgi:hypothetical protein
METPFGRIVRSNRFVRQNAHTEDAAGANMCAARRSWRRLLFAVALVAVVPGFVFAQSAPTATPTPTPGPGTSADKAQPVPVPVANRRPPEAGGIQGPGVTGGGQGAVFPDAIGSGVATRVDVCGSVITDTTWTADKLYVISGCTVTVEPGVTLRIDPGTVVKLWYWDWKLRIRGTLLAEGTAEAPIAFTSLLDDTRGGDTNNDGGATTPARGNWGLIAFDTGSHGRIRHASITYGGYFSGFGLRGMVESRGASDVEIEDATIASSAVDGLYAENASLQVTRATFSDNAGYGIELNGLDSAAPMEIVDSEFVTSSPTQRAGFIRLGDHPTRIELEGNRAEGTGWNGFLLQGDVIRDLELETTGGLPLIAESIISVAAGATLTIPPGTIFKFRNWDWRLRVYGALSAEGTADAPIVFTSLRDDSRGGDTNGDGATTGPAPGDWGLIAFNDGGHGRITHAIVAYGGYFSGSGLRGMVESRAGGDVRFEDVAIESSRSDSVYVENASMLLGGSVTGNAFGVRNGTPSKGVVDARRVWWGDAGGPLHRTKNPNGTGSEVSDGVLFFPWAVDEEGTVPTQVSISGPAWVSPGDTAEYGISLFTGAPLDDAVLVLMLPEAAQYVDDGAGGTYWPTQRQAFWLLGDLAALAEKAWTVRIHYEWGLPQSASERLIVSLAGAGTDPAVLDQSMYAAFQPVLIVEEREMTGEEIAAEQGSRPEVQSLVDAAITDLFKPLAGFKTSLSDGSEITELVLLRDDAVVFIQREGETVFAQRFGAASYQIGDAGGGMQVDGQLGTSRLIGTWSGSAAARAAEPPSFGPCMANCLLVRAVGAPEEVYAEGHPYLDVVRSNACVSFYRGTTSSQSCVHKMRKEGVSTAAAGWPGYLAKQAVFCSRECKDSQRRDRYLCRSESEEASFCLGKSFITPRKPEERDVLLEIRTFRCQDGILSDKGKRPCVSQGGPVDYIDCLQTGGGLYTDGRRHIPNPGPWPKAYCKEVYENSNSVRTTYQAFCGLALLGALPRTAASAPTEVAYPCASVISEIRVARDPNAKLGAAGDLIPDQLLHYTITYENEGAGRAYGVYVTDELSLHLDETTLELSGQGEFVAATRQIVWDIGELAPKGEPGSKGEVSFSIRLKADLPSGTVITNQAIVYFPSVPEETATNTVVNVVQPLAAVPQNLDTAYDTPIAITLAGRDVSGTALTYAIEQLPLNGELSGTLPNLTYTPAENFTGQDRFTFTVSNGVSMSRTADVTILVTPSPADTIAPEVLWTYPEQGAVIEEVPADPVASDETGPLYAPSVLAGFSEAMDPNTITGTTVRVISGGRREVTASVSWDGTSNQAVLVPREVWQDGSYTATVTTGAEDASGNGLAGEYSWSFRIGAAPTCTGDCSGDGNVKVDELVKGVNIALGTTALDQCASLDASGNGIVTVDELIKAVNNALTGCE